MRYLILILALPLCAMSPIYKIHDNSRKVDDEFTNVYGQTQAEQFRTVQSTPILSEMKDFEVVIVSSGAVKLMFRVGQEIYAVSGSCVTVRR